MSKKTITVRPRGDNVLIRRIKADTSLGGVAVGQAEQHRLFIEAVGDKVPDLKPGMRVLVQMLQFEEGEKLEGQRMPANLEHPLRDDLFLTRQNLVIAVIEGWE